MNLALKYRPKLSEFLGNEKAVKKLQTIVENNGVALIHGPAGVGKTSLVYAIAEKNKAIVIETNASDERKTEDLEDLLRRVIMKGFQQQIFLFDEVDGSKDSKLYSDIMRMARDPIVFTANDLYKVPKVIRDKSEVIRFFRPKLEEVVSRIQYIAQSEKRKVSFERVNQDFRASINATFYGGEKTNSISLFDVVTNLFRGKPVDLEALNSEERKNLDIWLLDNIPRFYSGARLIEALEILQAFDVSRNPLVLKQFPIGKNSRVLYPNYFQRLKTLRGEKVVETEDN